ncbi:MAG: barstar family protein [Oscillospiraceae bacterium]|nr:barstar family protein [Oscillospiraceae bacterium]
MKKATILLVLIFTLTIVACEEDISPSVILDENETLEITTSQNEKEALTNQLQRYYVDFAEAEYIGELHLIIKESLELPDWYGETLDALWDMLIGYLEPGEVYISGLESLPDDIYEYGQKVLDVFKQAEEQDGYSVIIVGES